jgi:hypothetical protein
MKLPRNFDVFTKKNIFIIISLLIGLVFFHYPSPTECLSDLSLDADKICQNVLITVQCTVVFAKLSFQGQRRRLSAGLFMLKIATFGL